MSTREADRWQVREALLDKLLASSPRQREARLAELQSTQPEEAEVLRRWLADIDGSDGFLETPAASQVPARAQAEMTVGPWRLSRPLGHGGMGEVWLAERADGAYDKQVAIKFMRVDTLGLRERFEQERRILARLEHPGIARLLDGGIHADGTPYLVTEYVDGVALDAWCNAHRPGLRQRLALFRAIAGAVAYAHANLVVHRDLKPANILVDAAAQTRLLDFGIAKLIGPVASAKTMEHPLTPQFAAPEQLTGAPITTATDVYALGGLLYLLLSGRPPLATSDLPLSALVHRVCEEAPLPPSANAGENAIPLGGSADDLDAIVLKALAKAPAERYGSIGGLLADLDNVAAYRPISARRPDWRYRASRYLRRHRFGLGITATVLLALLAGLVGTLWQAHIATVQRRAAETERDTARREVARSQAIIDYLLALFGQAAPNDQPVRVTDLLAQAGASVLGDPHLRPEARATLIGVLADIYTQRRDPAGTERLLQPLLSQQAGHLPDDVVARAACDLGQAERVLGKRDEAARWIGIGLAHAAAPGDQHAACLSEQAVLVEQEGALERSLALHRAAIAEIDPNGDAESGLAGTLHSNYAGALIDADRLAEARSEHQRALGILERLGRGATADAAAELAELAEVDRDLGLLLRADEERSRANALRLEVSGPSAGLAQQLINTAGEKTDLGQPEAALALLDRAEAMQRAFVGPESMHVAVMSLQRGRALAALARPAEAREQFNHARALYAKLLPSQSRFHYGLRMYEAEARIAAGASRDDARAALQDLSALETDLRALGDAGRIQLPKVLLDQAEAAMLAGDLDLASVKAIDARTLYASDSAPDAWWIAACDVVTARARLAHGDAVTAKALLDRAVVHLTRSLGPMHPRTQAARALAAVN